MGTEAKSIAIINNVSILLIENGQKLIPVKPICEALGIDSKNQRASIQEDPILGSVGVLSTSTGKDGKSYEMFCIPLKFAFGWLLKIDARNVKEEVREGLVSYQLQCYDALYSYFTSYMDFVNEKQAITEQELTKLEKAKKNFRTAREIMQKAESRLKIVRNANFDDYQAAGTRII
jgi:hypothetical protein